MNLIEIYQWTSVIVCIGIIQANFENLILTIRYPAINNFKFGNTSFARSYNNWLSFAFDSPGVWIIYFVKLILSLVIFWQAIDNFIIWWLPILYMFIELLGFQRQYFLHMSDSSIQRIILFCISIHYGFQNDFLSELGLWFISLQVSLAYFAAGFHKMKSTVWHDGTIIKKFIMKNTNQRYFEAIKQDKYYCKWMGWFVIVFELSYFLSLFGGYVNRGILIAGIALHAFISVGAGINFFFYTFIACYPAVYYTGEQLNNYFF
jgi:hypothetical protein